MDMGRNERSRRILDFTLEIIYLLSGEEYTTVKKTSGDCTTPIIHESGGWSSSQCPITEPPPYSRIHEKNNNKKILELIYKMSELLTGEVPIRCQDVAVYFSMEEWEYLEGHKDLYEEVMMESYRPRTSQDVCSTRSSSSSSFLILYSTTFLLLNDPPRMDKDRSERGRRILDFTLEIIYLLCGEEYTIVKTSGDCTTPIIHESRGWSSSPSLITEPPPHSRIHEKNNNKKIIELIYKMTELLTGEVGILGNSTVTALEVSG
ncbi:uncharacterized protein LOC142671052 [Rhinoderma darwinii]|uniref:uncharacterized protein LOC142671052 n=1 Tax=Rhinoderma darwinii TaxID=43563 RepID=UPI003F67F209